MSHDALRGTPAPIRTSPKYVHLSQRLLRQIAERALRPGDYLGTEAELAEAHGVSRVTVRQALSMLDREGYISREKAKGTFVRREVARDSAEFRSRGTVVLACSNEQAAHADEDIAFAALVMAVERNLTLHGFTSRLLGLGTDSAADRNRIRDLSLHDDVVAICTIGRSFDTYRNEVANIPIVTSCTFGPNSATWVGADTKDACSTSVEYLLANGHRQIALVCSPQLERKAFGLFAKAFAESFDRAGLECPRHQMFHAYPGESLEQLAKQLLTGNARPTAVFAENWRVCQSILKMAAELRVRVPNDISLVAFGRNVLQITYPLAVTAYVPDYERIGEKTVEVLQAVLRDDAKAERQIEIRGRLVERESVRRIGPSLVERR
jgi:GntR family transcriptional regulator of arabinose operon